MSEWTFRWLPTLVSILLLGAVGCDWAPSAPDIPDIPIPTISGNGLLSRPTATAASPTATSPAPSKTPDSAPASTAGADATSPEDAISVPRLEIAEIPADLPAYTRDDWKHWNDVDGDCRNTRAEVLIQESTSPPTFATDRRCRVTGGHWYGPYTGQTFTDAGDLDIDHLVPLKNAHLSGGWQWDEERKEDYANSVAADYHLIAVEKYANRAKGARGPEEWQPPDLSYHCQYARDWIAVKAAWDLSATATEWEALETMLAKCHPGVGAGNEAGAIDPAPLATLPPAPSNTPAPKAEPFAGSLVISEIMADPSAVRDAAGEWFEIYNPDGAAEVNLRGWTIRKGEGDGHVISTELSVAQGGYVVLARDGKQATNGGIPANYQYRDFNLTNDGDVIELVEPAGRIVDRIEYGEDLVFPGASTSLAPGSLDADANDHPVNWCRSTTAMPNGDFGTPGESNDGC